MAWGLNSTRRWAADYGRCKLGAGIKTGKSQSIKTRSTFTEPFLRGSLRKDVLGKVAACGTASSTIRNRQSESARGKEDGVSGLLTSPTTTNQPVSLDTSSNMAARETCFGVVFAEASTTPQAHQAMGEVNRSPCRETGETAFLIQKQPLCQSLRENPT